MKWRKITDEFIEVPMNKGNARFDFKERNRLELSVSGSRPNREVVPGMYFVRDGQPRLHNQLNGRFSGVPEVRAGVPVNDVLGADLSKLGWLRFVDNKWVVPNGPVKMKEKYVSVCGKPDNQEMFSTSTSRIARPSGTPRHSTGNRW